MGHPDHRENWIQCVGDVAVWSGGYSGFGDDGDLRWTLVWVHSAARPQPCLLGASLWALGDSATLVVLVVTALKPLHI